MKQFLTILLLSLIGFTACRHHTAYPLAMQQAEQLMNTRPDSALTLLQGMADTLAALPEETRMYHQLLTIQAKDKQYITHTSDSLINRIVSFYEEYGNSDRLMMAYFYQGSTYRDMNDTPRALKAFHQAIDAGKETKNLILLGQAYGQMGTLFSYQELYDEALEAKRKALQLYSIQKDSTRFPYLNRDIARIYNAKQKNDSALYYYQKAYFWTERLGLVPQKEQISYELGCFFYDINIPQKAKELLLGITRYSSSTSNALLYLGHIFQNENKLDSARFFWTKALEYGDIRKQCSAYLYLSNLEKNIDNKLSRTYYHHHKQLKDSINQFLQTDTIVKHHLTYKYQSSERENQQLRTENKYHKNGVLFLSFLLIALMLVYGYILFSKRRKHKNPEILESLFFQSDIYQRFHSFSRKEDKTTEKDWVLLQHELDKTYNSFTTRINQLCPSMSQHEQRICWLIKIKMSNREISNILYVTDSAISMARKRLYKKMVGVEGSGEQLNSLITDL